jgi:hypothetical protein
MEEKASWNELADMDCDPLPKNSCGRKDEKASVEDSACKHISEFKVISLFNRGHNML